jgi:hypothetical protein
MLLYETQGVYLPSWTITLHLLLLQEVEIVTRLIVCILEVLVILTLY